MSKIKWTFRMNNGGACGTFARVQGVRQIHLFVNADGPGFTLRGEGTPDEFARISDDIFGVNQQRRHTISLRIEVDDSTKLLARVEGLEAANNTLVNENEDLGIKVARLEGEIAMLKTKAPNPFHTKPSSDNHPTGEEFADKVAERAGIAQKNIGLPTGPSSAPLPLTPQQKRLATLKANKEKKLAGKT